MVLPSVITLRMPFSLVLVSGLSVCLEEFEHDLNAVTPSFLLTDEECISGVCPVLGVGFVSGRSSSTLNLWLDM